MIARRQDLTLRRAGRTALYHRAAICGLRKTRAMILLRLTCMDELFGPQCTFTSSKKGKGPLGLRRRANHRRRNLTPRALAART
jgi:hypothetical protein